jgi:hypothetical protein
MIALTALLCQLLKNTGSGLSVVVSESAFWVGLPSAQTQEIAEAHVPTHRNKVSIWMIPTGRARGRTYG